MSKWMEIDIINYREDYLESDGDEKLEAIFSYGVYHCRVQRLTSETESFKSSTNFEYEDEPAGEDISALFWCSYTQKLLR